MKPRFEIGQKVWIAYASDKQPIKEKCPTCAGAKIVHVVCADKVPVAVDCGACSRGYERSAGYITYYKPGIRVESNTITGMEINPGRIRYRFGTDSCYTSYNEDRVGATREEAEKIGEQILEELVEGNRKRAFAKEKDHKTWAWHVSYYKDIIRRAEREIEYAEKKLHIAKEKSKKNSRN